MRIVEFRRLPDGENALRIRSNLEHGKVDFFAVQLECKFAGDDWTPVVR